MLCWILPLSQSFLPLCRHRLSIGFISFLPEHGTPEIAHPKCARFQLETPDEVNALHVRQRAPQNSIYLCSTDARFKFAVQVTEELPFDKFVDDPRFVFARDGDTWVQQCRDPRI